MKKWFSVLLMVAFFALVLSVPAAVAQMPEELPLPNELDEEDLPAPFELNVDGEAQPFELDGIGGETISSRSLSGKTVMLVFGRITCLNTQAFLSGISDAMPLLREKGVEVLVGLADWPSDADMKAFSDKYGSVRCGASDNTFDNGMWNNMEAVDAEIVSVTFPVIFLKDSNDQLRYYSTGYVKNPLRVVSTALALAGADLPDPGPEPELILTADRTVAAAGQEITFTYESRHIDNMASPYVQWKVYEHTGDTSELVNRSLNWRDFDGVLDNNVSGVITHTVTTPEVDKVTVEALLIDDTTIVDRKTVSVIIDNTYINSQIEAFVSRCYQLILNREPDAGGLQGWCDALQKKTAAAANIIDGFVKSDEFTNRKLSDSDKVDILYRTMLDRAADAGGKAGWVDALSKGYTLQHIINGFCGSPEFTALCKDYGIEPGTVEASAPVDANTPRGKIEAFVKRCYQLILNRQADEGGLKGWSDALEGKTAAAAQIIDGFVRSPEFINRNLTSEQSVTILYKTMLDREPDAGGKAGWVDALGKGYTLQHIINGFCGSAEFTKICSDYGIQAGSVAVPAKAAAEEEAKNLPDERIGNAVSADEAGIAVVNGYEPAEVEAFVKHAYRASLGREADEAGLASWSEKILTGAVAPKAFLRSLLFSDELSARQLNNEQYIDMLYRLYLNRGADDAAAGWIDVLVTAGHDEVIRGFESSAEFRAVLAGFGL